MVDSYYCRLTDNHSESNVQDTREVLVPTGYFSSGQRHVHRVLCYQSLGDTVTLSRTRTADGTHDSGTKTISSNIQDEERIMDSDLLENMGVTRQEHVIYKRMGDGS
jgi:hypothetical protein